MWMESWATKCSGGKRNELEVVPKKRKTSKGEKCRQRKKKERKRHDSDIKKSGCTLLKLYTESHRSCSANPSWQWKHLTGSLVLLFPMPSIYVWQMFHSDAPVYVWVPCQQPPSCDFHFSRVAKGKNTNTLLWATRTSWLQRHEF